MDDLLNDKGMRGRIKQQLRGWGLEAANRCEGSRACSFGADSGWLPGGFKGLDAKNAIGQAKYRINASVSVGADDRVTTTYRVKIFKNWNFDRGKTVDIPYTGLTIDLG
ncbi:hypothetical protein ACFVT5_40500 [Streptomyces sp. NPDC058001]|uniref:hypothetical protein n=1 Tax=Streptomyces sp. NPDC058001 TaxID=3346300 RepID=UPI0036F04D9C